LAQEGASTSLLIAVFSLITCHYLARTREMKGQAKINLSIKQIIRNFKIIRSVKIALKLLKRQNKLFKTILCYFLI